MTDQQLVTALRTRSATALADLFDAYGERLFRYCWGMLSSREIATMALRDTFSVAIANIARLADAELLEPWLYSLARAECRRRRAVPQADEPPAWPSQADAEARLVAWNAAASLAPAEREALDLACRHRVDLSLVLGLPVQDVRVLLSRARLSLQQALGTEILVSTGSHDCRDRAAVLHGWSGMVTPELRERVLQHAAGCPACGPNLPRSVSAKRVFALLPDPALPAGARAEVLGFFADPRLSGYREFAVTRAPELAGSGFPAAAAAQAQQAPVTPRASRRAGEDQRAGAVMPGAFLPVAAGIAVAALMTTAFLVGGSGTGRVADPAGVAASGHATPRQPGSGTATSVPIIIRTSPASAATGTAGGYAGPTRGPKPTPVWSSTTAPAGPSGAGLGGTGSLTVTSGHLALGAGSMGSISVTVLGGPVDWSATTTSKQLTLSSYWGTLKAQQSVTLVVTVRRVKGTGGTASVYIDPIGAADQAIGVSWSSRAARSTPSPSASASRSASPSASPSSSSSSSPPPKAPVSPSASPSPSGSPSPSPSGSPSPSKGTISPSPAPSQTSASAAPSATPNEPSSFEIRLRLSI
ncbi:MAG: RNA polymerase sigma factor [Streptosporangiaceae bacterium]